MRRRLRAAALAALILAATLSACLAPSHTAEKTPQATSDVPYQSMRAAIATGRPEEALLSYEQSLAEHPQSPATRVLHARLLLISGKLVEAREEFNLVLAAEPRNTDALFNLSLVEGLEGHVNAQEALLREVVGIEPKHADALAGLGDLALARGDQDSASLLFARALEGSPTNFSALLGQGAVRAAAGDWQAAEELYTRAIAVQPDYPFAYIDRARVRRSRSDASGALEDLSQAIHLDPQYSWSYIDRGKIYLQQSHGDEAAADFSMAIRLDPDQFETYALRAQVLDAKGDDPAALADWERVAALKPDYGYAYAPIAALAWQAGDWGKAGGAFLKAYAFDEKDLSLPLCAALCAQRAGRQADVTQIVEPVLAHAPPDSWYRDVARFLIDRMNESSLLARIDRERNEQVKAAMLFYVAVSYLTTGMDRAGITYLTQIQGTGSPQDMETRLSRTELDRRTAN